jgi:hypothetical protein
MVERALLQLETRLGRRPLFLDPTVRDRILAAIRSGAWDYQAAQAAGVHKDTFQDWMTRGRLAREQGDDTDPYYLFRLSVEQAKAEARIRAEQLVFERRPDLWLLKGPGRERRGEPGWGDDPPASAAPITPVVFTFDIVKASGGLIPLALRGGSGEVVDEVEEAH